MQEIYTKPTMLPPDPTNSSGKGILIEEVILHWILKDEKSFGRKGKRQNSSHRNLATGRTVRIGFEGANVQGKGEKGVPLALT